jgi:hypothetical protein
MIAACGGAQQPSVVSSAVPPQPVVKPSAPDAPFVLDITLRARRIRHGYSIALDPTGELMKDDRLQFSVLTSQPGYLYIAFCAHRHDPRFQHLGDLGLSVFPKDHGIVMAANVPTIAPDPRAEIVLDDSPGPETLYLILSRSELSQADPALAEAISITQAGKQTPRCGAQLYRALARPNSPGTGRPGGMLPTPDTSKPPPVGMVAPPVGMVAPKVGIVARGVEIVFNGGAQIGIDADDSGIVVKRFDLKRVAAK